MQTLWNDTLSHCFFQKIILLNRLILLCTYLFNCAFNSQLIDINIYVFQLAVVLSTAMLYNCNHQIISQRLLYCIQRKMKYSECFTYLEKRKLRYSDISLKRTFTQIRMAKASLLLNGLQNTSYVNILMIWNSITIFSRILILVHAIPDFVFLFSVMCYLYSCMFYFYV